MAKLSSNFFSRPADELAPALLGTTFVFKNRRSMIVETEAYLGNGDLACHANKGMTKRTKPMFEKGGIFYIYLIYGMYYMLNIVSGKKGSGEAVLIRAVQPINFEGKTNGPGKLSRELGIDKNINELPVKPHFEKGKSPSKIIECPRIGIHYAGEWTKAPLRFYIHENPYVSKIHES